jgi:hypothetical protein
MRTVEQIEALIPLSDRSAQRFPKLREEQLAVVQRFAGSEPRRFAPREALYRAGDRAVPAWFLLEGTAELAGRDGLNQDIPMRCACAR